MDTDEASAGRLPARIVHVHLPKTAGTALSEAFRRGYGDRLRIYPPRLEPKFQAADYTAYNFFTGHIGFKVASEIGGDLITVLRDPVDRFLSTYYFLRQRFETGAAINPKTSLAARHDIDQFVRIKDEPALTAEFLNRMTWQLAYSHRLVLRQELIAAGNDDQAILRRALQNLATFSVVGEQTRMTDMAAALKQRYGVTLVIDPVNVTRHRVARPDISPRTITHIERWVYLDQQLYRSWRANRDTARA